MQIQKDIKSLKRNGIILNIFDVAYVIYYFLYKFSVSEVSIINSLYCENIIIALVDIWWLHDSNKIVRKNIIKRLRFLIGIKIVLLFLGCFLLDVFRINGAFYIVGGMLCLYLAYLSVYVLRIK